MDNIRMLDYNLKTHHQNLEAFERLIARIPDTQAPSSIVECFGGLGGQTKLLQARFPHTPHVAYERDEECFRQLGEATKELPAVVICHAEYERQPVDADTLLIVDGAITILHIDKYTEFMHPEAGRIIYCDFAAGKLHLHKKSYGLQESDGFREYAEAVAKKVGRSLLDFERTPRSMSYVLLGPVQG